MRSGVRRLLAVGVVSLSVAGCCEWGKTCLICEPTFDVDDIARVAVVPDYVYTAPGGDFWLRAIPKSSAGHPLFGSGLSVDWATKSVLTEADMFARITIPAAAPPELISDIGVTVEGMAAVDPATVQIGRPSSVPAGDLIKIEAALGELPDAVLVDGALPGSGEACADPRKVSDFSVAMTGEAHLPLNLTDECDPEVVIFTRDQGARLISAPPTNWTSASNETLVNVPRSDLEPRRVLTSRVRTEFVSNPWDAVVEVVSESVFWNNRTGISFEWEPVTDVAGPLSDVLTGVVEYRCDDPYLEDELGVPRTGFAEIVNGVEVIYGTAAPVGGRDPAHELHVVYVPDINIATAGFTCPPSRFRGPVIVLSAAKFTPTTAPHEFGHALGMLSGLTNQGHTFWSSDPEKSFDQENLMREAWDVCAEKTRDHFSLGQTFRMNFDVDTWIRQLETTDATRRCDFSGVEGVCPRLNKDVPGAGAN